MSRRRVSGVRAEKVDTRAVLRGEISAGLANGTSLAVRQEERNSVLAYWPEDLLDQIADGTYEPPPWSLLLRPTTWPDDPRRVVAYVAGFLEEHRSWPRLDDLMRSLGRVSNHRAASEVSGQASLLG